MSTGEVAGSKLANPASRLVEPPIASFPGRSWRVDAKRLSAKDCHNRHATVTFTRCISLRITRAHLSACCERPRRAGGGAKCLSVCNALGRSLKSAGPAPRTSVAPPRSCETCLQGQREWRGRCLQATGRSLGRRAVLFTRAKSHL